MRKEPGEVAVVACIGGGTIGSGWAAQFLAAGLDVVGWDPAPDGEARLRRLVGAAWPALAELGLAEGASPERLRYAGSLADAVAGADFVQESAPERSALKTELLAEIDAAAPPDIIIASSTSGLDMSELQSQCARPERTVVGHPFNPVYMVPLVEVAPGRKTAEETLQWACRFYESAGKSAVVCAAGLYGFLANRLQVAMFREALHMVEAGEATVEDLDRCISEGPGLRWAIMGPFLTFHLGGGEGGMRHFLKHMEGEEWNAPYTRLDAPPLTPELREQVIAGCERLAEGRSVAELAEERDRCLIAIQKVLADERSRQPLHDSALVFGKGERK